MNIFTKVQTATTVLYGIHWLKYVLLFATLALGALYIWQVNVTATRGFAMRDLQADIANLTTEKEQLNMEVARLQSVDSVTTRIQMLGLVKIDNIDYVSVTSSVAVNR